VHSWGIDAPGMIDNITSNEPADKYSRAMAWAISLDEETSVTRGGRFAHISQTVETNHPIGA